MNSVYERMEIRTQFLPTLKTRFEMNKLVREKFHCITMMTKYQSKSFEELRADYYFLLPIKPTMIYEDDVDDVNSCTSCDNIQILESKSFEEFRLDHYVINGKLQKKRDVHVNETLVGSDDLSNEVKFKRIKETMFGKTTGLGTDIH